MAVLNASEFEFLKEVIKIEPEAVKAELTPVSFPWLPEVWHLDMMA